MKILKGHHFRINTERASLISLLSSSTAMNLYSPSPRKEIFGTALMIIFSSLQPAAGEGEGSGQSGEAMEADES